MVGPEWSGASRAQFAIGLTYTGEVWAMNDATNLYVAAKVADSSLTASDMFWIAFDNNNDGAFVAGDDLLGLNGSSQFSDAFWGPGPPATLDTSAGGTSDGEGVSSGSGGFNYFEFKHPLDSGDDAHDFSLSPGSTVGFSLEYVEASGYWGDWPSYNPKSWAHITVAVPSPDFSISANPALLSIDQGATGTFTINATSVNAFSAAVVLSHSWVGTVPTEVTVDLPGSVTPPSGGWATSPLNVTASASASTGTFTLRVTGTSGALTHDTDVSVQITAAAADFTITAAPDSLSLGRGASGTSTIKVQSVGIFSAPVSLAHSGAPSGLTLAFSANPVIPPAGGLAESVLTVTVAGAASGTYSITITGTSGALTHSAALSVQVTAGGGCLIATATYGSELSDEVQFLRNFRDHSILETRTGSNFMTVFNAWYYSFSPTFAQFIREQSTVRTVTKFGLYPLMGILKIGAAAFYVFPANLEAGAVVSGLLVSSLIGLVYLTPPLAAVLAYSPKARRMARRLQLPTVIVLFGAVASAALITVIGGPAILMMIATSAIVLSCLLTSTLYTSRVIMQAAKRD